MFFFCLVFAMPLCVSVFMCLTVTCLERADLVALVWRRGWRRETGLNTSVKYFTDRSKAVLILWILYVFFLPCICYAFVCVCFYVPYGHLLGKG